MIQDETEKLKKYKIILLDGDGVLWKMDQPIFGINPFFNFLSEHGIHWALLTNNNSRTTQGYIEKFKNFGVSADKKSIHTSCTVTADYLLGKYGKGASLHVVGMEALINTLLDAGFKLTHGEQKPQDDVVAVVAGMDLLINYEKVKIAMRTILDGAAFIATNTDGTFPTPDGVYPGTGMVIGAIEAASGVKPYVVGKPYPAIFQAALNEFNVLPEDALMVGDRLNTDIRGASSLGIAAAAVLSGVSTRECINQAEIKPDFIFEDIGALHQALVEVYQCQNH